jgi:hypothetical protein
MDKAIAEPKPYPYEIKAINLFFKKYNLEETTYEEFDKLVGRQIYYIDASDELDKMSLIRDQIEAISIKQDGIHLETEQFEDMPRHFYFSLKDAIEALKMQIIESWTNKVN